MVGQLMCYTDVWRSVGKLDMCIMDPNFRVWEVSAVAKKFGHGASKSTIRSKERVPMIAPANVHLMELVHTIGANA